MRYHHSTDQIFAELRSRTNSQPGSRRVRLLITTTLALEDFFDRATPPPYAILSHRWSKIEVTLHTYDSNTGWSNPVQGYGKIYECCRLVRMRNRKYIRIDSLCIDKHNNVEFSDAVNSMLKHYTNAVACYAYLIDVPNFAAEKRERLRDWKGEPSEWFGRGKTLKELLAPQVVFFCDLDWKIIGQKKDLVALRRRREKCLLPPPARGHPAHDDESIFAWRKSSGPDSTAVGILATSNHAFDHFGDVYVKDDVRPPYMITNKGLQSHAHAAKLKGQGTNGRDVHIIPINCQYGGPRVNGSTRPYHPCSIAVVQGKHSYSRVVSASLGAKLDLLYPLDARTHDDTGAKDLLYPSFCAAVGGYIP